MPATLHLDARAPADIVRAAAILQRGGLVAFPTETVYGLGANAFSAGAVEAIFRAKQRPSWDPLIVHVPDVHAVSQVASVPDPLQERVHRLGSSFWPGPLTMLLPRTSAIPDAVTAGRSLVGVRVPLHPAAQALLRACRLPLAAPSANRFGHTSPTTAAHVFNDLDGRIDAVLDGGPCDVGVESTVLDPGTTPMLVYRAGAVTPEMLSAATGVSSRHFQPPESAEDGSERSALPSPGVGLRHYAPEIALQLTDGWPEALWDEAKRRFGQGEQVAVLLPEDWSVPFGAPPVSVVRWERWNDPEALARSLFAALRELERTGAGVIVCPLPEPGGVGDALRDRLLKAAKPR